MALLSFLDKLSKSLNYGFSDDILTKAHIFELSVKRGGTVVASPIEEGSFTTYNKSIEPMEITATLAFQGKDSYLQSVLDELKKLQESVTTFSIKTPSYEYQNMTLKEYEYSMRREDGYGVLYVDATFNEIKEVQLAYTEGSSITQIQTSDDSGTDCVGEGVTQPEEVTETSGGGTANSTSGSDYQAGQQASQTLLSSITGRKT